MTDRSRMEAAHRQLLDQAAAFQVDSETDPREFLEIARKRHATWGKDPAPFLACFEGSTQGRLAGLWLLSTALLDIEKELDRLCGPRTWAEISDDYSIESRLVTSVFPDAVRASSAFEELNFVRPPERPWSITGSEGDLVDPRSGVPLLCILAPVASEPAPPRRIAYTRDLELSCGISFLRSDDYLPDSVPITVFSNRAWVWTGFSVFDHLREALAASANLGPEQRKQHMADALLQCVGAVRTGALLRLPVNVRQTLRLSVVLDQITYGNWTNSTGQDRWGNPLNGGSLPILTPGGINPILMGGNANPFSFGQGR